MDEEFGPAMRWRNEAEASIVVPGPQNASELHAGRLTFDVSGGTKGAKRPLERPLDERLIHICDLVGPPQSIQALQRDKFWNSAEAGRLGPIWTRISC